MSTLGAFGPYLPTGQATGVDLGIRLREEFFCAERIRGPVRQGLKLGLGVAIESGQTAPAAHYMEGFLDSFAVAAMVDEARQIWTSGPDACALAVLAKAGGLICLGEELPAQPGGPWPRPSEEWIRHHGRGAKSVLQEHPEDGADWIADLLGLPLEPGTPATLPEVIRASAEELAERRIEIVSALVRGDAHAVELSSPPPREPESLLAMGEIRMEARAQRAMEAFGRAGLLVGEHIRFDSLLRVALAGESGELYTPLCQVAILPGTPAGLSGGELQDTGWLLWEAASAAVPVQPLAIELIRAMDGQKGAEALGRELSVDSERVEESIEQLRELGAVGRVRTRDSE